MKEDIKELIKAIEFNYEQGKYEEEVYLELISLARVLS